jgi:anti-sigma factor ChrR (cupin superfamily)
MQAIPKKRFEPADVRFASFALAYYGKPRMTRDLDIVVSSSEDDVSGLVAVPSVTDALTLPAHDRRRTKLLAQSQVTHMELNADFTKRAVVHAATLDWVASPMPGVERRMLDRVGDEVARATSIVRYAPRSHFSRHLHGGGEEFLVLEGVFQDEHGDYPPGSYIRNPPGSAHTPGSEPGCTIFVKLWQFDPADLTPLRLDTSTQVYVADESRPGVESMRLFEYRSERVTLERWRAGAEIALSSPDGLELLVLDGGFTEAGERFTHLSWLRLPAGYSSRALADEQGCRVWVKRGHLIG